MLAVQILHICLHDINSAKEIPMVMRMVSVVLGETDQVSNFKTFISDNLPKSLSACMPEPSHEKLCALLESMHNRIKVLEALV
jgi:hypothetical protein